MLWKIKLKSLLAYAIYSAIILSVAYFFDRFFQMLMFILFFELIQNSFLKRFHSDSVVNNPIKAVKYCKLITVTVEIIYLIYCKRLDISLYSNLFIIFIIATFNSLLQFYAERIVITKFSLSNLEYLKSLCQEAKLSELATRRLIMRYVEKKTIKEIAEIECTEEETIKQSIKRSKKKLNIK